MAGAAQTPSNRPALSLAPLSAVVVPTLAVPAAILVILPGLSSPRLRCHHC